MTCVKPADARHPPSPGERIRQDRISSFWNCVLCCCMIVVGTGLVERYFAAHAGHQGLRPARAQYDAWLAIAAHARWRSPEDVKHAHPKASILKGGRVVFNVKGNDYRLVVAIN